jgi:prophage antirepressor-like protein
VNQLHKVFNYGQAQVRTIVKDEEVWFVAKDVCEVLEIDPTQTRRLNEKQKGLHNIQTLGGHQQMSVINESGLYKLIFTSRKLEAEKFTDWVTNEVLPSVRKTGGYVSNDELFINTYLPHSDEQTKLMFRATLETVRKQNEQLAIMQPKAEYFDALVDRNLLTNFRDTAKELEIGQRTFINWLLEKGFVYRDHTGKLKPYGKYVPELFKLKDFEKNGKAGVQPLITPKGKETFRILLAKSVS